MAADGRSQQELGQRMDVVLVVELGRSAGAAPVAAGLALARARTLAAAEAGGWVLLAELDPRGGELMGRLVLGAAPRLNADRESRTGARELVQHLAGLELNGRPAEPKLQRYLVELAGERGLRILFGDPLVEGAARATAALTASRLRTLAAAAGPTGVIVDGGPWMSAEPQRLDGVDLVYAVVQARTAAENSRGVAEVAALWRQLRSADRLARLVVTVVDPAWPADEIRRLYEESGRADGGDRLGYRVAVVASRRSRRLLAQLGSGSWRTISNRALAPFTALASPIGDHRTVRAGRPPMPALTAVGVDDEHAYLGPAVAEVADRSADVEPGGATGGRPPAVVVDEGFADDPELWPFGDGGFLDPATRVADGPSRLGPPGVEISSASLFHASADEWLGSAGEGPRSPAVVAAMRARWSESDGNGAAPAGPAGPAADGREGR